MLQRCAIIEGGVAVNITQAEPDYAAGKGWVPAETANIGDTWDGSSWHKPGEDLGKLKAALIAAATAHRWEVETGGITMPNGVQVKTGTDDQARITSVIANAHLAGVDSVDFKAASGWVSLTLAEVQGIAAAIALHVQACFAAERAHHEAIGALPKLEDARAYDITEGWPA